MEGSNKSDSEMIMSPENSDASSINDSNITAEEKAALRGEVRPVSSSPEEEAKEEEVAGDAKPLSVATVVVGNASLNNVPINDDGTKNDDAGSNIKNDKVEKGVDSTHMTLKTGSSVINSAISSSVNTTALQLLGGTKKRKRKATSAITKSITKKKVLSSFQEEDDEGSNNKRMMDEFLATAVNNTTNSGGGEGAADATVDEEGGGDDHAENDEGKLPPDKLAAENSNTTNVAASANNNNEKEASNSSSSIQHTTHEGVIPPDRAMSPMPQTERENVPVCHSPNVPDVTTTTTVVGTSAAVATSLSSSGGSAAVANNSGGISTVGITSTNNINNNNNNSFGEHNQSITSNTMGGGGRLTTTIRMQQQNNIGQMRLLQQQQQQQHQQQASQQLAQRFSSSNSGGDGKGATNTTANTMNTSLQSQQQQQTQPPGWRVKLYRLNMDGTWDDCGTGRIQFYYARGSSGSGEGIKGGVVGEGEGHLQPQQQPQQQHGAKSMSGGGEGKKQPPVLKNLFRELGEPMLCMRAELSQKQQQQQQVGNPNNNAENKNTFAGNNNNNNEGGGPSSGEKVLLRTRVLLHEAYQCQGGNIITWCEPFHAHGKKDKVDAAVASSSSSNPLSARPQQQQQQGGDSAPASSSPAGVDLALSFQDNAGCKDIWQHILNVQSCAREMTTHFANNNNTTTSSSSSMSIHSPLSPIKVTTSSTHAHPLHNSPNSPDHDYVEDKLIAGGGGGGGTSLVGGISSRPSIWTNKDSNSSIGNSSSSSSSSLTNVENRLHSHNHALPSNKSPYSSSSPSSSDDDEEEKQFHDAVDHMTAVSMAAAAAASYKLSPKDGNAGGGGGGGMDNTNVSSPLSMGGGAGGGGGGGGTLHGFHMNNNNSHLDNTNAVGGVSSPLQLPKSPTWDDLQNIGDVIAGVHLHQREDFLIFLSQSDCAYIKLLLNLFPPAEERGEDMTELAVIIKTILLLNDPEIIEYVTSDAPTFESVCAVLEYDPELREKANHREFIRKCAKFRTVVKMEDDELVAQIHHLFRVTYLRDNVLRPTMDESSLSTLVSLAQFTQSDIIKGVITAPKVKVAGAGGVASELPGLSYLTKVVRLLAVEIDAIRTFISGEDESNAAGPICQNPTIEEESGGTTMWQQHLAPQDSSLSSRHIRRKGCLMFLKELFCKARVSLQQPEKDEFIESCVSNSKLLYLLGAILSDPNVGVDEQGTALEMVSVVAMHDPCVIRRHCLQGAGTAAESSTNEMFSCLRPDPNDHREVIFICPPNDLLLSILFVMSTATDAGILLQTSEIIRIILDTDIVGDQGTSLNGSFMNEENDINAMNSQNIRYDTGSEEQNSFLALFYDRYIQWLVAPFQYKMFISKSILPLLSESNQDESFSAINRIRQEFKHCSASEEKSLTSVAGCAVRSSFTLEILSFCVRAHVYRMKFFILRTRLLGTILKMLCQKAPHPHQMSSGGKCLKLASLKFLRSVLSVKDEFYHRHIVQYNLFAPVFDAFRITPVGRNLISSAVLEMCDFIRTENIKSLLEYIVTKHLTKSASPGEKSLEDIANPHVDTFAQLRRTHEENIGMHLDPNNEEGNPGNDGTTFNGRPAPVINKKALEDQRKYREAESEDSYFNDDDDDDEVMGPLPNDENASSLPAMSDTASLLADVSSLE